MRQGRKTEKNVFLSKCLERCTSLIIHPCMVILTDFGLETSKTLKRQVIKGWGR
jgi:hypothetical protein